MPVQINEKQIILRGRWIVDDANDAFVFGSLSINGGTVGPFTTEVYMGEGS